MPRKKSYTQELLEDIYVRYHCKTMAEAQEIFRRKYEIDKEADPKVIEELVRERN